MDTKDKRPWSQGRSASDASGRAHVPIAWRLPNPPGRWVGSEEVWRQIAAQSVDKALVWVCGAPGVGKTAAVLQALKARNATSPVLYIAHPVVCGISECLAGVFQALMACGVVSRIDWDMVFDAPAQAATTLVERVYEAECCVVLDDVHRIDGVELLLTRAAAYGRPGDWVAVGQDTPSPGWVVPVRVPAMERAELEALGRLWMGSDSAARLDDAIERSNGAPGTLLSALRDDDSAMPEGGQPETESRRWLLSALAQVSGPLSVAVLEALEIQPSRDLRAALVARNIIYDHGDGLELTPLGRRGHVPAMAQAAFCRRRVLAQLEREDASAREAMQALELATRLRDARSALRVLERHGERLMGEGYAPRVLPLLDALGEGGAAWRARCASLLGQGSLSDLWRARGAHQPQHMRYVINALLYLGQLKRAVELADRALRAVAPAEHGAGDGDDNSDGEDQEWLRHIKVLRAAALTRMGRLDEALEAVEAVGVVAAPRMEVVRVSLEAHLRIMRGEEERALEIAHALWRGMMALPMPTRLTRFNTAVLVFFKLQRLEDAHDIAASVVDEGALEEIPGQINPQTLVLLAALYAYRARYTLALRCLEHMAPYASGNRYVEAMVACWRCRVALGSGAWDGLGEQLEALRMVCVGEALNSMRCIAETALWAWIGAGGDASRAALADAEPWADESGLSDPRLAGVRKQTRALALLRLGVVAEPVALTPRSSPEEALLEGLWRAYALMLNDEAPEATLRELLERVRGLGLRAIGLEVRQALCEALLIEGQHDALKAEAALLERDAAESPRFAASARLFALCASPSPDDEPLWEALADADAPYEATRRARAVLGRDARLDRVDACVVRAATPRRAVQRGAPVAWRGAAVGLPWGLDAAQRRVWSASGEALDLSRSRVLFGLMETLATEGGAATKEVLVCRVWDVASYHPLRHDNRLRVAVRKLRSALADAFGRDDGLITTEEGYALRPPFHIDQAPDGETSPSDAETS